MIQPSEEVLRAIVSLEGESNTNWLIFKEWLQTSYTMEALNTNEIDDPTKVPIAQGSVRQLRRLLFVIKNAREDLERLQLAILQAKTV